ncbi:MAG: tRNA pseudouridine(38-40) synthase TruA [Coprococcus sp.]
MKEIKNYMFNISYDGGRYHGWEKKNNVDTIEGKLENVLTRMTETEVKLNGAGRTDAGVHAIGMIANGRLDTDKPPIEIKEYVNHYLPDDISVNDVQIVSDRFHARFNAKGKLYRYTCYAGDSKPVFDRTYTWVLPERITGNYTHAICMPDLERMRQAAAYLIGAHDFKGFCGNSRMKKSTVRTIYSIDIEEDNGYIYMNFHGNGFLQNMVRILTGTLLEVGYGRATPQIMCDILETGDRQMAGPTAPPHGLCLMKVYYEEEPS